MITTTQNLYKTSTADCLVQDHADTAQSDTTLKPRDSRSLRTLDTEEPKPRWLPAPKPPAEPIEFENQVAVVVASFDTPDAIDTNSEVTDKLHGRIFTVVGSSCLVKDSLCPLSSKTGLPSQLLLRHARPCRKEFLGYGEIARGDNDNGRVRTMGKSPESIACFC